MVSKHRKVVFFLADWSCVILLTDDTVKTGYQKPMFLQNIMGAPVLSWLTASLAETGCGRFFLLCQEKFRAEASACFPQGLSLTVACGEDAMDQLHVFLSTARDDEKTTTLFTAPAMLLPRSQTPDFSHPPVASGAYQVDRRALMDALDERFSFRDFLGENGKAFTDRDGFYPVSSMEDLAGWQTVMNRETLLRLAKNGVEIWDYNNCYVSPDVFVGAGTVLMPGTILRSGTVIGRNCRIGPNAYLENTKVDDDTNINASQLYGAIVGSDCQVGPFAYIRPGTVIGNCCRVGDFVEVKNSTVGDGTSIAHLTYVGDSDVGKNVNFGCGTVTVNYDRQKKHRTIIGNDCFIGCNTNLVAPVTLGDGAYTAAGSTITDDVPQQALAIARARQTVKKDWAKEHKVKE